MLEVMGSVSCGSGPMAAYPAMLAPIAVVYSSGAHMRGFRPQHAERRDDEANVGIANSVVVRLRTWWPLEAVPHVPLASGRWMTLPR